MSSRSSGPTRYRHTGSGSIPNSLNIAGPVIRCHPLPASCPMPLYWVLPLAMSSSGVAAGPTGGL